MSDPFEPFLGKFCKLAIIEPPNYLHGEIKSLEKDHIMVEDERGKLILVRKKSIASLGEWWRT